MNFKTTHLCACAFLLAAACSSAPEEPSSVERSEIVAAPSATEGAAYVHKVSKSRFHLGNSVSTRSEFGMEKFVGDEGVFATVTRSGWALGILNADAATQNVSRTSWNAEAHNQAVVDYFVAAGLNRNEIARVNAHANLTANGAVGTLEADLATGGKAAGYTSCIARTITGILVPDSFAWAGFNDNQDVVEEGIYWPEIPAAAIAEAKALREMLTVDASAKAFRKLVGDVDGRGDVVIRHPPGGSNVPFKAEVVYDVPDHGRMRHFDANGREAQLADEVAPPASPSKN